MLNACKRYIRTSLNQLLPGTSVKGSVLRNEVVTTQPWGISPSKSGTQVCFTEVGQQPFNFMVLL